MITILAIDPGRSKTGVAVVRENLNVLEKKIIPTDRLPVIIGKLLADYKINLIVTGDGTYSRELQEKINEKIKGKLPVVEVDETHTTELAEQRYREEKGQGWQRLFNIISWKPSRPLDDYVAVILAERYFAGK